MRIVYVEFFCCLLLAFAAQTMTADAQTLSFRNILDRAERPQATHKIAYGNHADQYGELWLPTATTGLRPVVVLIHGGCWRADLPGPELVAFLADALRQQGAAVWSITYRRVGTNVGTKADNFSPYPDTFKDVAAAADKLVELASKYQLDLRRVVTTGHSAGGHLAMWLAARPKLPQESALFSNTPLTITSVVGIAAMPDLQYAKAASAHACGADTVDLLINTKDRKDAAYLDTSITPLLPLGVPQVLVSGVYDAIVAPAQALRHRERAKAKGETVTLMTIDDAGHFELIAPWTPAGKRVVDTIIESTKPR
jgi:acetyl esterase/lipase